MKKVDKQNLFTLETIAKACLRSYHVVLSRFEPKDFSLRPFVVPEYDFNLFTSMDAEFRAWISETLAPFSPNNLYTSPSNLTWMYIHSRLGELYLGPVFFSAPSQAFLQNHQMNEIYLPVVNFLEFSRLCSHVYALLDPDGSKDFSYTIFQRDYESPLTEDEMYFNQTRDYANVRILEKQLNALVKSGNVEGLEKMANISLASPARLAQDDLRDAKNRFIVTLTLVMRAAVDGGLPPEIAYPLSDVYLRENENLLSASQVMKYLMTCVFDYTNRVRDYQTTASYGPLVRRCRSLILANINENLKITDLAGLLCVSPDHLSRQFKKETGQSILDYIQSQKTKEAIRLLKYTNVSLVTIAHRLGYSSQGQFTSKFKKSTGITPAKYRLSPPNP